jgi:hypothetical protein
MYLPWPPCRRRSRPRAMLDGEADARRAAYASFGESAPAPLRACARHHSLCLILRLRFNLSQPGVSIPCRTPDKQTSRQGGPMTNEQEDAHNMLDITSDPRERFRSDTRVRIGVV